MKKPQRLGHECIFCIIRSFEGLFKTHQLSQKAKDEISFKFLFNIPEMDLFRPIPEVTRDIHKLFKEYLNNPDPYKVEKENNNKFLMGLFSEFQKKVSDSENPFETALRLAIAGNIIDYATNSDFDIMDTIRHVLISDFGINHSSQLKQEIEKADTILYLGDNAGEIVLDKLFIKTINHPNVYFAVKGGPIINDVTMEDAISVGINEVAKVISNGYDAPSTIIQKSSDEFVDLFNKADLVISKGQGNLEGLINNNNKNIFFLLMVKCDLIGRLIGAKKGDFVVKKNNNDKQI